MDWQKILGVFAGIGILIICSAFAVRIYRDDNIKIQIKDWSIAVENSSKALEDVKAQLVAAQANCEKTQAVVDSAQAQLNAIGTDPTPASLESLRSIIQVPSDSTVAVQDFSVIHDEVNKLDSELQALGTQLQQSLS